MSTDHVKGARIVICFTHGRRSPHLQCTIQAVASLNSPSDASLVPQVSVCVSLAVICHLLLLSVGLRVTFAPTPVLVWAA